MSKYAIEPLDNQISSEPSLIPRIPCILNIVSPIGCGKSTLLIRLITQDVFFKGKFHRIILFSPTVFLDRKWESALNVKGVLKRYPHESTEETIDLVSPVPEKKRFTGRIHEEDVYTEYSEDVLEELVDSQISFKNQYGEDEMPRCLVIFEDAGGLNLFKGKSGTRYVQLITTLRHYKISIWTAIQSYKLLPVPVRINCTNLIIFRIKNKQEVRKIYDEFPMVSSFNEWFDLFLCQNFDRFVSH
jgi:hypothetical protein